MKILGISGSLRKQAYNTRLLQAAGLLLPPHVEFTLASIADICLYNEDLDHETKPSAVSRFLSAIHAADALLFATPEYNHSIPGSLKNAIDWASRPAFDSVLTHKPCGILSAAKSPVGGARAQADLKHVLDSTLSPVYPSVEYHLGMAHEKFDTAGRLSDTTAIRHLQGYINGFIHWLDQTQPSP